MNELDLQRLTAQQRQQQLDDRFAALVCGESLIVLDSADPVALRAQFDLDHAGSYSWAPLQQTPERCRIQITRLTTTELPRVLCNTQTVAAQAATNRTAGAVWKLQPNHRHLDANIIHLPAHDTINSHAGPDLDVLILVVDGEGDLITETENLPLSANSLIWLPRRSIRTITAGSGGLTYFTVHQRRPGLAIGRRPPHEPAL